MDCRYWSIESRDINIESSILLSPQNRSFGAWTYANSSISLIKRGSVRLVHGTLRLREVISCAFFISSLILIINFDVVYEHA